jgi:hypothetical protein
VFGQVNQEQNEGRREYQKKLIAYRENADLKFRKNFKDVEHMA